MSEEQSTMSCLTCFVLCSHLFLGLLSSGLTYMYNRIITYYTTSARSFKVFSVFT
jgi:hypothetical protein